jgi:hypothetical protein
LLPQSERGRDVDRKEETGYNVSVIREINSGYLLYSIVTIVVKMYLILQIS